MQPVVEFEQASVQADNRRARWLAGLGFGLTPLYVPVDMLFFPGRTELLWARGLMTLASLLAFAALWRFRSARATTHVSVLGTTSYLGLMATSCAMTSGHKFYLAGLAVVFLGTVVLTRWSALVTAVVYGSALATYTVVGAATRSVSIAEWALDFATLAVFAVLAVLGVRERVRWASREAQWRQELSRANADLTSIGQVKDRLFQNLSHELRTPLTLILAAQEKLASALPATLAEPNRSIRRNSLRLLGLVNDLLELASLDSAALKAEQVPVDVGAALARLRQDVEPWSTSQGQTWVVQSEVDGVHYLLDRRHFDKVLLNLVSNALKFTPRGGTVTLTGRSDPSGLVVSVTDSGPGISRDDQARLFARFVQLDGSASRGHRGTGIGLALARELTELMGGRLELVASSERGSTFAVSLPIALAAAPPPGPIEASATAPLMRWSAEAAVAALDENDETAPDSAGERGPHLLVIDDNAGMRNVIAEVLAGAYRLTLRASAEAAVREVLTWTPDLIITDYMMPEVDGVALCHTLRSMPNLSQTPIVMLSARGELDARVAGRSAGADTYLTKPFEGRELIAAVEGLLRARQKIIGGFWVRSRIGSGGQSEVWLAERQSDGTRAAVKLLLGSSAGNAVARARLAREARLLASLQHPNLLRVLETGSVDGGTYIATEYVDGFSVRQSIRQHGPMSQYVARELTLGLLDALEAAHAAGVIHRDVKSDNVMVTHVGPSLRARVRLIDFGAASEAGRSSLTPEGLVVGTLGYLAPELMAGEPASVRADLFSVGVLLFEMLVGRLPARSPFTGAVEERVRAASSGVSPELDDIIARVAAGPATARFASAAEFRAELEALELAVTVLPNVTTGRPADDLTQTRQQPPPRPA